MNSFRRGSPRRGMGAGPMPGLSYRLRGLWSGRMIGLARLTRLVDRSSTMKNRRAQARSAVGITDFIMLKRQKTSLVERFTQHQVRSLAFCGVTMALRSICWGKPAVRSLAFCGVTMATHHLARQRSAVRSLAFCGVAGVVPGKALALGCPAPATAPPPPWQPMDAAT